MVRVHFGEQSLPDEGYRFFLDTARDLAARHFSLSGIEFGGRPPVYPYILALAGGARGNLLGIVAAQSLIGAGTVLCAYLIGRELFSVRIGLISAAIAAIYPYYVVHDTAIQETSALTFFSALSTYVVLVAARRESVRIGILAGLAIGVTVLTRLTMLPFAVMTVAWLALRWGAPRTRGLALAGATALPVLLLVAAWIGWTAGDRSLTTVSDGVASQFWMAHNPGTFSAYPDSSIDLSRRRAMRLLSPEERAQYASVHSDERALEKWFVQRAWTYVRKNPLLTARNSARMLVTGFSWQLSPRATGAKQLAYALSYAPVAILGVVGFLLSRARWRTLGVLYANFLGFVIVTAIFWAHTSHRVYLDVFLMVFAAFTVDRLLTTAGSARRRTRGRTAAGAHRAESASREDGDAQNPIRFGIERGLAFRR